MTKRSVALVGVLIVMALLGGVSLVGVTWAAPGNAPLAQGGAPAVVAYQGEVHISGTPYSGAGYFKFAVVNVAGTTTYWSNDGTSTGGGEPTAAVQLAVSEGLFSVLLGDTALGGMTQALAADVFSQPDRYLRVWFSSDNIVFDQLAPDTRIAAVPYALQAQEAADADTVDGLHASELETHYQNVVVVAKSGGDYTSVQSAIDSITDAAADNPYLVWVAPGEYSETVTMKMYVHLQGAGQDVTIITSTADSSALPPTQATLVLATDSSLRDLTLGNSGAGDNNTALLATAGMTRTLVVDVTVQAEGSGADNYAIFLTGSGTDVTLQHVTSLAENGINSNLGLLIYDDATAMLRGGSFTGTGGTDAFGIFNRNSGTTLDAESVTVLAENGSSRNFGLYNYGGAKATLRGGTFTGRGGGETRGIENANSGSMLTAEGVTALGENGISDNYGLGSYDSATTTLYGGSFTGRGGTDTYGIANGVNSATLETESVTALAENGSDDNYGLHNFSGATTRLRGGTFTGTGGTNAFGIFNLNSGTTLEAESVTVLAENSTSSSFGLYNYGGAEATLRGGSFTGSGGVSAYGIFNTDLSTTLEAESVSALGTNGSTVSYGLYNDSSATANVTQSVLVGATNSVYRVSGAVAVSNSRLAGNAVSGTVTCVLVTRGTTISTDGSTCP